jgi:cystathionine beta-lyase
MMSKGKFDFDRETDRRDSFSLKWDVAPGELPMWVADMDFETAPCVKEAVVKRAMSGIYGYSVTPDSYFEGVSDFFFRRSGYRFLPEHMVFCTGVVGAISSMVRKLTTPAEKVLLQPPVYNIFYNSILNNGRNVITSPLVYREGEYCIDFADLDEKLSDPQTTLMILCNPHNPVGKVWSGDELSKIGELCHKHGVTVISDEIHSPLTDPGISYTPFASASDICAEISATCLAASKAFNLAGLQSATVVAKDPVLRHKIWRGINTDEVGEPNAFAMDANIAAYTKGDEWLDSLREYIYNNKCIVREYIKENLPRLKVVPSEATYLLWIDISSYSGDSVAFAKRVRELTGLYLSDGAEYGEGGEHFVRMNVGTTSSRVRDGLDRLKRALDIIG